MHVYLYRKPLLFLFLIRILHRLFLVFQFRGIQNYEDFRIEEFSLYKYGYSIFDYLSFTRTIRPVFVRYMYFSSADNATFETGLLNLILPRSLALASKIQTPPGPLASTILLLVILKIGRASCRASG